jgi:hypothetical protein
LKSKGLSPQMHADKRGSGKEGLALRSPFIVASRVALRDGRGARKGPFFSLPTLSASHALAFRVGYVISHLAVL